MPKTIALLGHPVAHSISPAFQQAALDAMGVDASYEAWDTRQADLPIAIERLRSGSMLGANVTIPHKVEAMRFVDRPDALTERVGAINTIYRRDAQLHATNTDVTGILAALHGAGAELVDASVVLIGAGGAARAVVTAMRQARARRLTVANRTEEAARALVEVGGGDLEVRVVPLDAASEALRHAMRMAHVVVQATSLGMLHGPDEDASPVPPDFFQRGQYAFDLVYIPERTPFLRDAEAAGAHAVLGLDMLVHQGVESFRLWTGLDAPVDVMFAAARRALEARTGDVE